MAEGIGAKSPFKFILKSKDPFLNLEEYDRSKVYDRVLIQDNIYDFYPILDVNIVDKSGLIVDAIVSAEGKAFSTKIGSDIDGYDGWLESEWVWHNNETTNIPITWYIGGSTAIAFNHITYRNDIPKTRAWNDTISNIVRDIAENDYGIDPDKIFITNTTGKKVRQQAGIDNRTFLKQLTNIAYSQNFEYSPFITFINSKGEFYFCAIDDLLQTAERVNFEFETELEYTVESDIDSSTKRHVISTIENIKTNGLEVNRPLYKSNLIRFDNNQYRKEKTDIVNHLLNETNQRHILINKDLKEEHDFFSYKRFGMGLFNSDKDFEDYRGYRNSLYKKSLFNMRKEIIIPFNHKAITGKILPIEIGSVIGYKNGLSVEHSGNWLILESRVFYDADGIPYTVLEIAKNYTKVDIEHVLHDQME